MLPYCMIVQLLHEHGKTGSMYIKIEIYTLMHITFAQTRQLAI